ncbi:hypothetical protein FPV67DRAFT_639108 [Lyophyllum atratum]|nr:hypothetical protein FPV67DRAFT_639108 [Lyophyllum atratum]
MYALSALGPQSRVCAFEFPTQSIAPPDNWSSFHRYSVSGPMGARFIRTSWGGMILGGGGCGQVAGCWIMRTFVVYRDFPTSIFSLCLCLVFGSWRSYYLLVLELRASRFRTLYFMSRPVNWFGRRPDGPSTYPTVFFIIPTTRSPTV